MNLKQRQVSDTYPSTQKEEETRGMNKQISELGSVGLNVSCKRVLCSVLCTVYILFFMYMLNIYKIPSIN